MKRKWFVFSGIAAITMVGMFVFENTASAHRLERSKREHRGNNSRAARGRIAMVNPFVALNNSWTDLTFGVKADDETLAKARPIYQETRDELKKQLKEARKANTTRSALKKMREIVKKTDAKFNASLRELLTEEQLTKLTELTKARRTAAKKRLNRFHRIQRGHHSHRSHR